MDKNLYGKPVKEDILNNIIKETKALRKVGIIPTIKIFRATNKADDIAYENSILKIAKETNTQVIVSKLDENITTDEFIDEIKKANEDKDIHGILIFRPFGKHIDEEKIKMAIDPKKDIDAFSPINLANVFMDKEGLYPATAKAVLKILKFYNIELEGKNVVVVGRSLTVSKPASMMLLKENATVTICHSKTKDLNEVTNKADILVLAIGKANMFDSSYIKEGAVVIDCGINFIGGKMVGDLDYEDSFEKAKYLTPVPGGVGVVTNISLIENVIKAIKLGN